MNGKSTNEILTVPNLITGLRIVGTFYFWLYFWSPWVFVLVASLDFLDGFLARNLNQKSRLGETIDPLADKVLALPLVWYFWSIGELAGWIALFVAIREIFVVSCKAVGWWVGARTPSLMPGKLMFVFECAAIFCMIYGWPINVLAKFILWPATVFFGFYSLFSYLKADALPIKGIAK